MGSAIQLPGVNALRDVAEMIIRNGGTFQNTSQASNWQGGRGGSAGLAFLATDHAYDSSLLNNSYTKVVSFLNANYGSNNTTRAWNLEGLGYMYYPMGNWVGPFGIAMKRFDENRDISTHIGLQRSYWTIFEGATNAMDVYGFGGVKADWSDDNTLWARAPTDRLSYLPDDEASAKWAYDRLKVNCAQR